MIAVGLALILLGARDSVLGAGDSVRPRPCGEPRPPFYDGVLGSAVGRPSPEQTMRVVEAVLRGSLRIDRPIVVLNGARQDGLPPRISQLLEEELRYVIQRSGNGVSAMELLTSTQVEEIIRREKQIVKKLIESRARRIERTGREYQGGSHG